LYKSNYPSFLDSFSLIFPNLFLYAENKISSAYNFTRMLIIKAINHMLKSFVKKPITISRNAKTTIKDQNSFDFKIKFNGLTLSFMFILFFCFIKIFFIISLSSKVEYNEQPKPDDSS